MSRGHTIMSIFLNRVRLLLINSNYQLRKTNQILVFFGWYISKGHAILTPIPKQCIINERSESRDKKMTCENNYHLMIGA